MIHHFCGYTEEPVRVYPKYDFHVWIKDGACEDGTPSVPTSGRILADVYGD